MSQLGTNVKTIEEKKDLSETALRSWCHVRRQAGPLPVTMDLLSQQTGAQLASVQVATETSQKRVIEREARSPSKSPAKRRKVSRELINEEVVSETEDERETGFLYPCVREHRSSGSSLPVLMKAEEQIVLGGQDTKQEDAKDIIDTTWPAKHLCSPFKVATGAEVDVKESQAFDHQDTPRKLKLDLSKFLHTSTAPGSGSSSAVAKRTQSTPAVIATPGSTASKAPRRAVSASSSAAGPSTAGKTKQKAKVDLSSKPIHQNEPIHPLSLELSSIEEGRFKCLTKCPLCLRRFPASHAPSIKSRHIGSCAAERNASEDVVVRLIETETESLQRAEVKKRRKDEEDLTIYSRVMAPLERQRGKKISKNAVFTTLKPAHVGQKGARQAMRELFASPLLNEVPRRRKLQSGGATIIDQGKGKAKKEELEEVEILGSKRDSKERNSQRKLKTRRDILSLYDFELTEEQDYTLGMLPIIGSQRPIVPPSLTYASQMSMAVTQGQYTQGAGLAAAAAGSFGISKLATLQLCTRSRLGLGIGCLAERDSRGQDWDPGAQRMGHEGMREGLPSWLRPMSAASASAGVAKPIVRAVQSKVDDCPNGKRPVNSSPQTTERAANGLQKDRIPAARTILREPREEQDDIGERAAFLPSWPEADIDLFDFVSSQSRVLVPCSQ